MKRAYCIQTILVIIFIALTPLLVNKNPLIFSTLKLDLIYASIFSLFLIFTIFFKDFKEEWFLMLKIFRIEKKLIPIGVFFLVISFLINYKDLNNLTSNGISITNVYIGIGPNFLTALFYLFSLSFIILGIVSVKFINKSLIAKSIIVSLVFVGIIIIYQIFVFDFLGRGQHYLYGWGNSNYTPDPFSIIGIMLLIPLLIKQKIKYSYTIIGIFFFEIVLLSSSRAAYLGLIISFVVSAILLFKKKETDIKRITIFFLSTIAIAIASYLFFIELGFENRVNNISNIASLIEKNESSEYSLFSRFDLWRYSLELFSSSPKMILFGSGQSVFVWDSETMHYVVTNTHNQYIEILLSSGIVVFLIFIILLYRQFIYAIRLVNYDMNNIALLASLIFIGIKWIFNSLNASHSPFVLIVFVLISYRYMEMQNKKQAI